MEKGKLGLRLTKQVMKVLDRIVDRLRQFKSIDESQFGRGPTDAIFVQKQLQEKYLAANK